MKKIFQNLKSLKDLSLFRGRDLVLDPSDMDSEGEECFEERALKKITDAKVRARPGKFLTISS